jgi:hypothetical protein
MPLKTTKPKTPQEVKELIEMFRAKIASSRCSCSMCVVDKALSHCVVDALLWSLGKSSKEFSEIVIALKTTRARQTKHQCAHAE